MDLKLEAQKYMQKINYNYRGFYNEAHKHLIHKNL